MIKELLKSLNPLDRKQLMFAFNQEQPQYIELPNNKFIGVNVKYFQNLKIEEQVGVWACGKIVR